MRPITLLQPQRMVFGNGCAVQAADQILSAGCRRVFIVTSPPLVRLVEPLAESLRNRDASVEVYSDIASEPTLAMFESARQAARALAPDAVVGLGGGSPLDVAKLVAALHDRSDSVRDLFGIDLLPGRKTFLVCLPTTAGTGSEVSPNSILLDEDEELKKGVISPHLVPDAAYVDPELTLSLPPAVTASTGLDALTHCIEAYANRFAHPTVDLYALEGIRLISCHLPRAVANGQDIEARARVALGSLYGGLCLGPVNTAAVHALAYPLGGEFHVAHGLSNAVLLPFVLDYNLPAAAERYAEIAVAMGVERKESPLETARAGLRRIRELVGGCGVELGLSRLGVGREAIPGMARAAMTVTRLLKNNPRELRVADAESIYQAAL